MANFQLSRRKKRGKQPDKLSVRLFLLDPEKDITKVTKETCSKEGIKQLIQAGYGPPKPEHCTSRDDRVEFSFELTNEQFKQKLVEIYPRLENSCFVFMKADKNNKLEELNLGGCCYRCYTPENVYHSERGQGRLYIRKIPESEISQCFHGVSHIKRFCPVDNRLLSKDAILQRYQPIFPKPLPPGSTSTIVGTDLSRSVYMTLPISGVPGIESRPFLITPVANAPLTLSSSSVSVPESRPQVDSSVNMITQSHLPTVSVVSASESRSEAQTSVNTVTQNQLSTTTVVSGTATAPASQISVNTATQSQLSTSVVVSASQSRPLFQSSVNTVTQNQLPDSTVVSASELRPAFQNYDNMLTSGQLATSSIVSENPLTPLFHSSGNMAIQSQFPASTDILSAATPASQSSVDAITQSLLPPPFSDSGNASTVGSLTESRSPFHRLDNMVTQNDLPTTMIPPTIFFGNASTQGNLSTQGNISTPAVSNSVNMVTQGRLPTSSVVSGAVTKPAYQRFVNAIIQRPVPTSIFVSGNSTTPPVDSSVNMVTQYQLPTSFGGPGNESRPGLHSFGNMETQGYLPTSTLHPGLLPSTLWTDPTTTTMVPSTNMEIERILSMSPSNLNTILTSYNVSSSVMEPNRDMSVPAHFNNGESMQWLFSNGISQTPLPENALENAGNYQNQSFQRPLSTLPLRGENPFTRLHALAELTTREHGSLRDEPTLNSRDWTTPGVQGNMHLPKPTEFSVDAFLETVQSTGTLEISLAVLNNGDLLKKLDEPTINIHTIEIQSSCKLNVVLKSYALPSCLKVLRINGNCLNLEDIFVLVQSLKSVDGLYEVDLARTKFKESSFNCFISVLLNYSGVGKLCLSDNSLTEQEHAFLTIAFESMKHLIDLNLSKSNLTETQASNILQKLGEGKSIVSLDLSGNSLQGNKIIIGICQLQSLEELNLSHNHIRFFPLPDLEQEHDNLPVNTKIISLSYNHMRPSDISCFCSLIRSDPLELNLDFNRIDNSIWSLCSLGSRISYLKVLSLENTDIYGPAVGGLGCLLSLVRELEELNLSSNNLMLNDFRHLQPVLSNLTQLKRLNLSNIPAEISVVLKEILPSLKYLEKLGLSNIHLNGNDCSHYHIWKLLSSLKGLKYLDLSDNVIGQKGTKALASILKEFPLLEQLDVSRSFVKEDFLYTGLHPLNKLKYLNLSGNRIDIGGFENALFLPSMLEEIFFSDIIHGEKLFAAMRPLHSLRKLHLSKIKLRPCDVEALATMLPSFPLLEELVLADMEVADTEYERIFSAVKSLKNIKKIDLTGIKLYNDKALADMLSSQSLLEELVLANMNVADTEYERIFSAVKSLKNIKKIDLTGIKLYNDKALADMLSSQSLLEELVLANMNVADMKYERIFSAIKFPKNMRKVSFHRTIITKTGATALANVLPSLRLLEKLELENIRVDDDESGKQLITALGSLKYLKKLRLEWTGITHTCAEGLAAVLPSLQLLEKLELRHFWFNDDESEKQLITALGSLKYLKKLELICVSISPTGQDTLAAVLPSLQLLEKLVLGDIYVADDESEKQLFTALGSLKYLKNLRLQWTGISETCPEALAAVLPSLQLLEKLVLRDIDIDDDEGEKQLFTALGSLKYLKKLKLEWAGIAPTTSVGTLAAVLPSLQLLEKLKLGNIDFNNESDDESEKQLFTALGSLKYLKKLNLWNTRITQTGGEALAAVLPSLQLLEKLVLHGKIDFDDESEKQLFTALRSWKYLKNLKLNLTDITQTGADTLAAVLPSLQLLEKLKLGNIDFNNESDDESEKQLFTALGSLKYLKKLNLKWIKITQTGTEALAAVLPSLQLLEELELGKIVFNNESDDESEKQLFTALGSLKYLKKLNLKWTEITATGVEALAAVLPTLRNLQYSCLPEVIVGDKNGALRNELEAAARLIPGLEVDDIC